MTPGQVRDQLEHVLATLRFRGQQPQGNPTPCSSSGRFLRRRYNANRKLTNVWRWSE